MSQIKTYYDPKPIPIVDCDWTAIPDGYEPGYPVGHGSTEAQAIAALNDEIQRREEIRADRLAAAIREISIRANSPDGSRAAMDRHLTEIADICAQVIGDWRHG